ncbi:REPEAT-CONTAINING PROTEIN putative-RELATED [Salix viminalis]|uniref:REPEAT-CONTAINING PROTEIN putative-RELATED n=1 Tax=Salix viminalis TaxID=40686 RepID=A0A9Q0ZKF5_SALVM|nr:REPEAT-CONTAINING PROTEIN putative-RELATED [Salix viminalis]
MSRACREIERNILRLLHGRETRTQLREIHAHFLRHGLNQLNQILSHFVSICGSLNKMAYANRIFKQTQNPTIILFNAMIKGYSLNGPFEESFRLFSSMKNRGIWPDEYTLAPLLKACSSLGVLQLGKCIHKEVLVVGFEGFSAIRIGFIEFYSSCGAMEDAEKVFGEIQMRKRSVVSWNIMISCLAQTRRNSEALGLFHEMLDWGFKPDEATVVTVLPICARLGAVDVGQWIHSYAKSSGIYRDFVAVGNALVDFYNKSGMFETARRVFEEMPRKNVISWNTLISGLAFNGNGELGVELLEEMLNEGLSPNDATLVGVLSCCAHAGTV